MSGRMHVGWDRGSRGEREREERENVYKIQEIAWFDIDLVKRFAGFHQYVLV